MVKKPFRCGLLQMDTMGGKFQALCLLAFFLPKSTLPNDETTNKLVRCEDACVEVKM